MSSHEITFRRATLDDLPALRQLWLAADASVADCEKRLKEFQVACAADHSILACFALQISEQQARAHTVALAPSESAERFRDRMHARIRSLAKNHGLLRVWAQERDAPWFQRGFVAAEGELRAKLPAEFGPREGNWLVLQLREEAPSDVAAELELDLLMQRQRERNEQAIRRARWVRSMAALIALGLLFVALWAAWYIFAQLQTPQRPAP